MNISDQLTPAELGKRLRIARETAKVTQEEAALAAGSAVRRL